MLRVQGIVAVTIPWVVTNLVAPGSWQWGLLALVVPLLFAGLHRRQWIVWLAPVSGLISITPLVPAWMSAVAAAAVAVALIIWMPRTNDDVPADGPAWLQRRSVRWAAGSALLVAAVVLASVGLTQIREQDAAFEASQEVSADMWQEGDPPPDEPEQADESPDPVDDIVAQEDPTAPLVGQPLEVQEEAAVPVKPPFAKLRFVGKGTDEPVVTDRVLYVGPDVTDRGLAAGPGHYPQTAKPGKKGNIAIAGHRTGWGSPFLHLNDLQPGDRIKVVDRKGVRHTYVVDSSTLVKPDADWVLGDDPLGTGEPTLTLTTCDPPSVNTDRLIVFATLKKSVPLKESA